MVREDARHKGGVDKIGSISSVQCTGKVGRRPRLPTWYADYKYVAKHDAALREVVMKVSSARRIMNNLFWRQALDLK